MSAAVDHRFSVRHQLKVVAGSMVSSPVAHLAQPIGNDKALSEVPSVEGFYMLYTTSGCQPVQVSERNDVFVYRTFDGVVSPALPQNAFLVGPITSGFTGFESVPGDIKDAEPIVALEKELHSAYNEIGQYKSKVEALFKKLESVNSSDSSAQVADLTARLVAASEELQLTKAALASKEQELSELGASASQNIAAGQLSPQLSMAIARARMVLNQARAEAQTDEAREFLSELVSELAS